MKSFIRSNGALLALMLLSVIALTGFGCRSTNQETGDASGSLVVWGLWQESETMKPIIEAFKNQTGIDVEYKKMGSVATYEKDLLEAIAEGRGPDVFVINSTWVEGKRGIMSPAPKEIVGVRMVQEEFVSVVAKDLIRDGFVYALPTSVDTMALYYNEDILSGAGIAQPPKTWQEMQRAVEKITKVSRLGAIEQSAVAMGTAANINRASDIMQLLLLQSGIPIVEQGNRRKQVDLTSQEAQRSLVFYTDFSNKSKKVYTWNLQQDFSIDAFAEGDTAMMFNYSYHIPTVKAKNPRLNFSIAPMPQIADSTPVTVANYWPFTVSTTSRSPRTAWTFVKFMTDAQPSKQINEQQGAPPARRANIQEAQSDPEIGVFAEQALQAQTWPRVDLVSTDAIFNRMIDDVVTGAVSIEESLRRAEDQLTQLVRDNDETQN